ncbi:Na+/melibiose symporter [Carboxydocella sporoproducens DSM 16521]|uniref:Na+/melibiose symporter n=2 Tax=Carboxydocella TaxID=178898 RepID=A0A1T4LAS6_9FIRM|nr:MULTISPECIES: MFS transporter [Carboxydocella]AVX19882.1 Na+/melibiose symporter [Carboxydocella thermautotrophica]SJZ51711.1 Na+/melibiose symporter [Carboxydocella sporoproducens DSM 16521]
MKKIWGLPRNVFILGWVSFFNDLSSEIVIRTLPLFLSNILGVKTSVIGLIEGIADTTATLLKFLAGYLSDRIRRRKPWVVAGYLIPALSRPFLYFASSWLWVLGIRFLDRVGKGIRTAPRDALIADSVAPEERGQAFGFHRAIDPFGAVLGATLAALLVYWSQQGQVQLTLTGYRYLVLAAIIPVFIGTILLIFFVKEVEPKAEKSALKQGLDWSLSGFDWRFKVFLLINILFTLGNSSDAFLLLRAQNVGLSVVQIFFLLALFNLLTTAVAWPAGKLSDRIPRIYLIVGGWLVYAVVYLGFAIADSSWQVWFFYALYGVYYGATEGVAKALVADLVPAEKRGTAYGLYNFSLGISLLPASLLAGWLWQWAGPAAPFYFGSGLALLATAGLWYVFR